ncbi:CehA/McbA family metallohydrolase [Pseudoduganella sp. GCM10020061]|uniref:CehA/McbA family metallohydrolase n=1 Tax=Pseudoduganella sp. GCM10020061 TaxID=3317345 RepID=UPI00363EE33C
MPRPCLATLAAAGALSISPAALADRNHHGFEATLHAPYQGDDAGGARTFTLSFDHPTAHQELSVHWTLALEGQRGEVLRTWSGELRLPKNGASVRVPWRGRIEGKAADGRYTVRMRARARPRAAHAPEGELIEQAWEVVLGPVTTMRMAGAAPMSAPSLRWPAGAANAAGALPYQVYYGNLHSQTNHSDGGADVGDCSGAQEPGASPHGPLDAFTYARGRGLDFLMASEHNHMYDGADGHDPQADPGEARALYRDGLAIASAFTAASPGFVALYGMEWGVISNGGHVNILGAGELLGWERNDSGELLGDTLTPKNDYAALYTLMRQRGWLGQFNHPSWRGQFQVGGVAFGYTDDGGDAMALCEVLNTSAFSTSTSESETRRSSFEGACNKVLEAGFRVAFSSNQDNHCANWGASYTNRTGILVPSGVPFSEAALMDAIRARRVFATMDKGSQVVLTANGRMMGERFANSGPLRLLVGFANAAGKRAAAVVLYEGVPGRNGTVTELARVADAYFTPAPGEHFYYAKVTQEDGNVLWSAPVWVSQQQSGAPLD